MLEFIILGEIPGTSIQITFSQIVKFVLFAIAVGLSLYELHLRGVHIHIRNKHLSNLFNRLAH